jgi:GNAT superfamily N-acetyltransferase
MGLSNVEFLSMGSNVSVHEVSLEEAVSVHAQIPELQGSKRTIDDFQERIQGKDQLIIVGDINNQHAGYIVGYDRDGDKSFYCWMAGVIPKFRKRGVMSALMQYFENWARENGYQKATVKTRNTRREMLSFLVQNNYLFTAVDPRERIEENRILLEKEL